MIPEECFYEAHRISEELITVHARQHGYVMEDSGDVPANIRTISAWVKIQPFVDVRTLDDDTFVSCVIELRSWSGMSRIVDTENGMVKCAMGSNIAKYPIPDDIREELNRAVRTIWRSA